MGLWGPNTNFFCFLDHIDLGHYLKVMAILKEKMPIFWKRSPTQKNVTAQKSLKICFYLYLDGQKEIFIFFEKIFFGTPFEKKFFFTTSEPNPIITLGY